MITCKPKLLMLTIAVEIANWSTYLLKQILSSNSFQNILFTCLLNLSAQKKLIQHKVSLFKVEDDIKLTHLDEQTVLQRVRKWIYFF